MELPDSVVRATTKQASFEIPKDMKINQMRGYDSVHPPMRILTWKGQFCPTAHQGEPELKHLWDAFIAKIEAASKKDMDAGLDPEIPEQKTICFEQDGFSFDADGIIVIEVMDFSTRIRAKKRLAQAEAAREAQKVANKYMEDAGFGDGGSHFAPPVAMADRRIDQPSPTDVVARAGDGHSHPNLQRPHAGLGSDNIDLGAWARGEVKLGIWAVKKAFRDQHAVNIKDSAHGIQWLQENGKIPSIA